MIVRKAVIPAAGLGTRFLPATRVLPKEMLPVAGKPLLQHAVEEAAVSGIETVIVVLRKGKEMLLEHLRREWERDSNRLGDETRSARIRPMPGIAVVWQDEPLGLAHAVGCARSLVESEPFAVLLPDVLVDSEMACTAQLSRCYEQHGGCVMATGLVKACDIHRFGILEIEAHADLGEKVLKVAALSERPSTAKASSAFGIFGRYILSPDIFECIDQVKPGFRGEVQLTDALALYSRSGSVFGFLFDGKHYDAGDPLGYLQANLEYAMKDPALAPQLRRYLNQLVASPTCVA
jgi:UTP--glucose-1-phosphate uridylyltransferase